MIYYHGTSSANLPGIMAKGLVPDAVLGADMGMNHRAPSIYLTPRYTLAQFFAGLSAKVRGGSPAILAVQMPDDAPVVPDEWFGEQNARGEGAVRYEGTIPAASITPLQNGPY